MTSVMRPIKRGKSLNKDRCIDFGGCADGDHIWCGQYQGDAPSLNQHAWVRDAGECMLDRTAAWAPGKACTIQAFGKRYYHIRRQAVKIQNLYSQRCHFAWSALLHSQCGQPVFTPFLVMSVLHPQPFIRLSRHH